MRLHRRKTAAIAGVLVLVSLVSLFILTGHGEFVNPADVFSCYGLWLNNFFAQLSGSGAVLAPNELLARNSGFFLIVNRVPLTLITILCGGLLAVAGTLYQNAFRNPIASPSMLGVSSAIQLGDVVLVMLLGGGAVYAHGMRYLICYACIAVVMVVLFGCGRFMTGKGRPFNIVNLLLIATILNQIIGVLVTYVTMFYFTFEEWEVFTGLSEALEVSFSPASWLMLALTCVIGLLPVALMRFRLNALSFDDAEMRLMGVNANRLRVLAVLCGTVLLMGAQVEMGTVAMVSLVVPHVSRMVFGAEFRKQFWGNVLMGAALLVFCRDVVAFIPYIGGIIPLSVVVNFVVLPFFVWMLATQQRSWGQ